jgi:hypothetical protein
VSTFTKGIGIEKPTPGSLDNAWGPVANGNYDYIDAAIAGYSQIVLTGTGSSGSPTVLTIPNGSPSPIRSAILEFTDAGDLGNTCFVRLDPDSIMRPMFIRNRLSGDRNLVVFQGTYDAGRAVTVQNNSDLLVLFSGAGSISPTVPVLDCIQIQSYIEREYAIVDGSSVDINPRNGPTQTWTLGANRTPTANAFSSGQSITLVIQNPGAFNVTWPSVSWLSGSAPGLSTTQKTFIVLFKVSGTLYGQLSGYAT